MKQTRQSKEYETPEFRLVRTDEPNKVFFAASGVPVAGISDMTRNESYSW